MLGQTSFRQVNLWETIRAGEDEIIRMKAEMSLLGALLISMQFLRNVRLIVSVWSNRRIVQLSIALHFKDRNLCFMVIFFD